MNQNKKEALFEKKRASFFLFIRTAVYSASSPCSGLRFRPPIMRFTPPGIVTALRPLHAANAF